MILPKTKRGGCPRNIYSILAGYFVDRRVRCSWRIRSYGVEDSSDGFPAGIGAGIHALELRLSLPWGGAYADDVTILVRYIFPGEGRGISLYSITTHRCVGIDSPLVSHLRWHWRGNSSLFPPSESAANRSGTSHQLQSWEWSKRSNTWKVITAAGEPLQLRRCSPWCLLLDAQSPDLFS